MSNLTDHAIQSPTLSGTSGEETVLDACLRGLGYRIRCVECSRKRDWSTDRLLHQFAHVMGASMREVADRLVCECGSKRLAIYAYQSTPIDTGHRSREGEAERKLVILAKADQIVKERGG